MRRLSTSGGTDLEGRSSIWLGIMRMLLTLRIRLDPRGAERYPHGVTTSLRTNVGML